MDTITFIKNKMNDINKKIHLEFENNTFIETPLDKCIIYGGSKNFATFRGTFKWNVVDFTEEDLISLKKEINEITFASAVSKLLELHNFSSAFTGKKESVFYDIVQSFAKHKQFKNKELFLETLKQFGAELTIPIKNILVYTYVDGAIVYDYNYDSVFKV